MKLELIHYDDPVLRQVAEPFDFEAPIEDPQGLVDAMFEVMVDNRGIGLAAPQVGLSVALFILNLGDAAKAFFNPSIVALSNEMVTLDEACLSWPGMSCKLKRPKHVRIRFQDASGETFTETFTGMTARAVQHEYEHLEGKIFFEGANRYHRDQALKKWRRAMVGGEDKETPKANHSNVVTPQKGVTKKSQVNPTMAMSRAHGRGD